MTSTLADAALFVSTAAGLSMLLKATVVLTLGLSAAWLARRQPASLRHLLLVATFATLLALPWLTLLGPALSIEVPIATRKEARTERPTGPSRPITTPASVATNDAVAPTPWSAPSWSMLILGLWAGGAALLMVSLTADLWRVRRIVRNALPWIELGPKISALAAAGGIRRVPDVLLHEDAVTPFVCQVWRPAIVLPATARAWVEADLERALVHELEHVRRVDWAVQIASRAVCACYWCHPLAWVAWRRLCLEAERACDDAVAQRTERTEYAAQLVALATRMSNRQAPVLGMAHRSDLASRVASLLDATQRRGRTGALAGAATICSAAVIAAALAPVRAVAVSIPDDAVVEGAVSTESQARVSPSGGRSSRGDMSLLEAASQGDVEAITGLLDAGADVNAVISGDGSPLIAAAREGHVHAVRLLLDRGAGLDLGVPGDGNPLIMAAAAGHLEIVTLLLDRGADIEHVVSGDENPLIQASGNGRLDVVRLLVSRGADVNARVLAPRLRDDGEWRTPLSMARRNRHASVVELLRSAGAAQ